MNYREAVQSLIKYEKMDFKNPFFSYSCISDLIGNNYSENKLAECFFAISKEINIFDVFKNNNLAQGRSILIGLYPKLMNNFTKGEFINTINPITEILCPKEYAPVNYKKPLENAVVIHKNGNNQNVVVAKKPIVQNKELQTCDKKLKNIEIIGQCRNLKIYYHNFNKIFIEKQKSNKKLLVDFDKIKNNKLRIKLTDSTENYCIYLPNKKYNVLKTNIKNTSTEICGSYPFSEFKCNKIEIKSTFNSTNIISKGKEIVFNGNGFLNIASAINLCSINGDNLESSITITGFGKNKNNHYSANVKNGKIKFNIYGHKIKLTKKSIFKRMKTVNEKFVLKNKKIVDLDLNVRNGFVKIN